MMHAFKSIHFKEILPKIFSCTPPKKETLKEGGANSGLVFKWKSFDFLLRKKVVLGNYCGFKVSKRRTYNNNNTRQLKTFITWGLAMAIKAVPTKCQVGLANEHCQVYLSWNSHNECTAVWSQPNSLANNFKREQLIAIHLWGECNKFSLEAANT